MSRPVKRRTEQSYRRDVEHLTRLRTAIKLDSKLDKKLSLKALQEIESLTNTLVDLIVAKEGS